MSLRYIGVQISTFLEFRLFFCLRKFRCNFLSEKGTDMPEMRIHMKMMKFIPVFNNYRN